MTEAKKKFNLKNFWNAFKKFILSVPRFLRNMVAPQKVTWPTFKDSVHRTGIVLVVTIISAGFILLMDTLFSLLLKLPL